MDRSAIEGILQKTLGPRGKGSTQFREKYTFINNKKDAEKILKRMKKIDLFYEMSLLSIKTFSLIQMRNKVTSENLP